MPVAQQAETEMVVHRAIELCLWKTRGFIWMPLSYVLIDLRQHCIPGAVFLRRLGPPAFGALATHIRSDSIASGTRPDFTYPSWSCHVTVMSRAAERTRMRTAYQRKLDSETYSSYFTVIIS
jgi:hypothetical protein